MGVFLALYLVLIVNGEKLYFMEEPKDENAIDCALKADREEQLLKSDPEIMSYFNVPPGDVHLRCVKERPPSTAIELR